MATQSQPSPKIRIALLPVGPALKERIRAAGVTGRDLDVPFSVERVFFLLRWLVVGLGMAIGLYVAGSNSGGVTQIAHVLQMAGLMAIFTGLFGGLRYYFTSEQGRTWIAILDAVAVAVVIGLDGGIYSPFQFLSYLIIAEAALIFSASNILSFTALVSVLYAGAVLLISGQKWTELTITIVMSQVVAMFIVASVSGSMVRAIKHQRDLARREQALSAQLNHQVNALSALNQLSERLNASLDIEELMRSAMEALPAVLDVDACVGWLAERDENGGWQPASVWYGIDDAFKPAENDLREDESDLIQVGPLVLSRADLDKVLETGLPLRFPLPQSLPEENTETTEPAESLLEEASESAVLIVPLRSDNEPNGALALLRQAGPAFDTSDQELLAALGRHLSLLIKNARLYEMERQNVARLQELEQMKSDFLSAVSHELRTPLTSIKASNILLMSQPADDVSPTALTLYKNIDRNTERLNGLVTDLLDLAKLENGRLRLSLRPTQLAEVVNDVVASMRPLTDNKGQTIQTDLPLSLPSLNADRRRLEQVITNLVSNAHRYTPRGGHIEVQVCEKAGEVLLYVRDNGPGIEPSEQKLIFDKFYRSQSQQSSKTGTGLGLAIARSLVELHGGRIWVESTPGMGSVFCFSLPKETVSSAEFLPQGNPTGRVSGLNPGQQLENYANKPVSSSNSKI